MKINDDWEIVFLNIELFL